MITQYANRLAQQVLSVRAYSALHHLAHSLNISARASERCERHRFFYRAMKALSYNGITGDYAEFGCCGGTTFGLAFYESKRHRNNIKLWAFDSFAGLPTSQLDNDVHPHWIAGQMATSEQEFHRLCKLNGIPRDRYSTVPGMYDQSLAALTPENEPSEICLAYIDCDLYSSTKQVLQFLAPRLKHGMILAFDDYFCWSDRLPSGERLAVMEMFDDNDNWRLLPFVQFGWHGQSFVVERKGQLEDGPR